jgi:hypothetical protein
MVIEYENPTDFARRILEMAHKDAMEEHPTTNILMAVMVEVAKRDWMVHTLAVKRAPIPLTYKPVQRIP